MASQGPAGGGLILFNTVIQSSRFYGGVVLWYVAFMAIPLSHPATRLGWPSDGRPWGRRSLDGLVGWWGGSPESQTLRRDVCVSPISYFPAPSLPRESFWEGGRAVCGNCGCWRGAMYCPSHAVRFIKVMLDGKRWGVQASKFRQHSV